MKTCIELTWISNNISITITQRKLDNLWGNRITVVSIARSLGIFILMLLLRPIRFVRVHVFVFQREAQEREEAEQVRLEQMRKEQEEEKEVRTHSQTHIRLTLCKLPKLIFQL